MTTILPIRRSPNDHPSVDVRPSEDFGMGLFATKRLEPNEPIASFDGKVYRLRSVREEIANDPPLYACDHVVQFEPMAWRDSDGIARYANHSCDPNCGIRDLFTITTMRAIDIGEELKWDYAMTENDGEWTMDCRCETALCRKKVLGFSALSRERRAAYEGFISSWLVGH
ncbi:MAG: SET domain-containing protein-lysine N-methyltransferase [Verrucomicrobiota bacterium]